MHYSWLLLNLEFWIDLFKNKIHKFWPGKKILWIENYIIIYDYLMIKCYEGLPVYYICLVVSGISLPYDKD